STTLVPGPVSASISSFEPLASTLLPRTAIASTTGLPKPVQILPPRRTRSACLVGSILPFLSPWPSQGRCPRRWQGIPPPTPAGPRDASRCLCVGHNSRRTGAEVRDHFLPIGSCDCLIC